VCQFGIWVRLAKFIFPTNADNLANSFALTIAEPVSYAILAGGLVRRVFNAGFFGEFCRSSQPMNLPRLRPEECA
jgi:hypothetical protein